MPPKKSEVDLQREREEAEAVAQKLKEVRKGIKEYDLVT